MRKGDDLASFFEWKDNGTQSVSETHDPHVMAVVSDKTVQVDVDGVVVVLDNHAGREGGKRVAEVALDWLFALSDALDDQASERHPSGERKVL